jgi:hypothetical protein
VDNLTSPDDSRDQPAKISRAEVSGCQAPSQAPPENRWTFLKWVLESKERTRRLIYLLIAFALLAGGATLVRALIMLQ